MLFAKEFIFVEFCDGICARHSKRDSKRLYIHVDVRGLPWRAGIFTIHVVARRNTKSMRQFDIYGP